MSRPWGVIPISPSRLCPLQDPKIKWYRHLLYLSLSPCMALRPSATCTITMTWKTNLRVLVTWRVLWSGSVCWLSTSVPSLSTARAAHRFQLVQGKCIALKAPRAGRVVSPAGAQLLVLPLLPVPPQLLPPVAGSYTQSGVKGGGLVSVPVTNRHPQHECINPHLKRDPSDP